MKPVRRFRDFGLTKASVRGLDNGTSPAFSVFGGVVSLEVSEGVLPPRRRRRREDIVGASAEAEFKMYLPTRDKSSGN